MKNELLPYNTNILIAMKLFGWRLWIALPRGFTQSDNPDDWHSHPATHLLPPGELPGYGGRHPPDYSEDKEAIWELAKKLHTFGIKIELSDILEPERLCRIALDFLEKETGTP